MLTGENTSVLSFDSVEVKGGGHRMEGVGQEEGGGEGAAASPASRGGGGEILAKVTGKRGLITYLESVKETHGKCS